MSRNPELSEDDAAKLVAAHIKSKEPKNYGYYRVSSLRSIAGGCKLRPKMDSKLKVVSDQTKNHSSQDRRIIWGRHLTCQRFLGIPGNLVIFRGKINKFLSQQVPTRTFVNHT